MKQALVFFFFSAFLIGLANSDCTSDCTATYNSAILGVSSIPQLCTISQNYLSCLSSCSVELSSYIQRLKGLYGSECDYSGSTSLSVSLFAALVGPLFAAYRILGL